MKPNERPFQQNVMLSHWKISLIIFQTKRRELFLRKGHWENRKEKNRINGSHFLIDILIHSVPHLGNPHNESHPSFCPSAPPQTWVRPFATWRVQDRAGLLLHPSSLPAPWGPQIANRSFKEWTEYGRKLPGAMATFVLSPLELCSGGVLQRKNFIFLFQRFFESFCVLWSFPSQLSLHVASLEGFPE